jgi:hypothetical protein
MNVWNWIKSFTKQNEGVPKFIANPHNQKVPEQEIFQELEAVTSQFPLILKADGDVSKRSPIYLTLQQANFTEDDLGNPVSSSVILEKMGRVPILNIFDQTDIIISKNYLKIGKLANDSLLIRVNCRIKLEGSNEDMSDHLTMVVPPSRKEDVHDVLITYAGKHLEGGISDIKWEKRVLNVLKALPTT